MQAPNHIGHGLFLHHFTLIFSILALFTAAAQDAMAVDACVAPPGNSVTINALAGSTTYFSIPFTRTPAFCGSISSLAGNTITVGGNPGLPGLTPGPDSYYVVITSGAKEGAIYTTNAAVAMTADTVTVSPTPGSCEDLNSVNPGDEIAIIPYWTLATVFPGTPPANITAGTTAATATDILLFNPVTQGFETFYHRPFPVLGGTGWRSTSSIIIERKNQRIEPYQTIVVLQHAGAGDLSFPATGTPPRYEVKYATRACLIAPAAGATPYYNFVSNYHYYSPGSGQTLDASGLANSFAASNLGASPPQINDKLLVYDNTVAVLNKTPSHTYVYDVNHWTDLNNPPYTVNRGGDKVFEAGTGVVIVRVPNASSPLIWVDPL